MMAGLRACVGRRGGRGGFTLVEMLISLTIGLIILTASVSFAITTFQGVEGNKLREEIYRSGRFIGMSLNRDIQTAGVGIQSGVDFGTLSTFNDTLVILAVPWDPVMAPAYEINAGIGPNPLPPGGTCGSLCIDLSKDSDGNFDLAPGDLARLQVNTLRHLLLITGVQDLGGNDFRISFLGDTTLLHHDAAFHVGLLLDRYVTTVQKLKPIVYRRGLDPVSGAKLRLYRGPGGFAHGLWSDQLGHLAGVYRRGRSSQRGPGRWGLDERLR